MTVTHIVGARPNFMKAAPVMQALSRAGVPQSLIHTGQHYDEAMSGRLFAQLGMPTPDVNLNVGSGTHAQQTSAVMTGVEARLLEQRPRLLVVYGDVNSTMAAALVAAKLQIPIAHVEAGLRSFDRTMPEEVNRVVTDRLSTLLFTPSADGDENLLREGMPADSIHRAVTRSCCWKLQMHGLMRQRPKARSQTSRTVTPRTALLWSFQAG